MTANEIRQIREKLGFTREEFAQILGTHMTTVYRWEIGKVAPDSGSLKYLHAMKRVLNEKDVDVVKDTIKNALIIGGALLAIYVLLGLFFEKE